MKFSVIVPTYQGGKIWRDSLEALQLQSVQPLQVIVIDSSSTDGTLEYTRSVGFEPVIIPFQDFNHGGTRNFAVRIADETEILVFLTQDALLDTTTALESIIKPFQDVLVAAVCGRQTPHVDANPLASHARTFNYPNASQVKSADDISSLGLKVAFMSNSFAAYRRDIFDKLGGFPKNTILAEDMYITSKMILAGYKVAYCAEASVRHSHNYTPWEEFRRYFDTGVFHACEPWIQQQLGGASGEGLRFVKSELHYLWQHAPVWIPRAFLTMACKLVGYKLGKNYQKLPKSWRPKFSMYKSYWLQQNK